MRLINNFLKLLISLILFFSTTVISNGVENKILIKVNNEIITSVDLLYETEYLVMLNENLNNIAKEKLFEIAKNSLIKQKIKNIELSKYNLNIIGEEEYLEILLKEFIQRNNLKSRDELANIIDKQNITIQTILERIKTEIYWNQLILNKFSNKIKVDREKIKKNILKNNVQKKYLLSEIVFNLENETLDKKFNEIKKEIKKNGFKNTASIFSISESSKEGGKIGWVNLNSLNKKIKKEILSTELNDYTNPIVIPGGFLILKIDDKKEDLEFKNIEAEVEKISKVVTNKQLNQFSNIYYQKIKKEFQINEF